MLAAMHRGQQVFASVVDPADRPPETARQRNHHQLLGIDRVFHAKTAADIGRDHMDLVLRDIE